jgi:hypothetical protein
VRLGNFGRHACSLQFLLVGVALLGQVGQTVEPRLVQARFGQRCLQTPLRRHLVFGKLQHRSVLGRLKGRQYLSGLDYLADTHAHGRHDPGFGTRHLHAAIGFCEARHLIDALSVNGRREQYPAQEACRDEARSMCDIV